jgi:hypothetical protein
MLIFRRQYFTLLLKLNCKNNFFRGLSSDPLMCTSFESHIVTRDVLPTLSFGHLGPSQSDQ